MKKSKVNTLNKRGRLFGNKGFTLIELIVVIAVIGVLVLLAAPKLLSYTEEAKLAQIKNDTKVVENAVHLYMVDNDDQLPEVGECLVDNLQAALKEGRIFSYEGVVAEIGEDVFFDITESGAIKDAKGKLRGDFIANIEGDIFYIHTSSVGSGSVDGEISESGLSAGSAKRPSYTEEQIADLVNSGYTPVETAEELNDIRNNLSGKYIQVKDIDLSEHPNWSPIGTSSNRFTGTYNGGNFKITGLAINRFDTDYVGLFGYAQGATIENVGLEDADVTGRYRVGGLVGWANSSTTISNSYASGVVTGSGSVGGLVGNANSSTISNSYASGPVTGSGDQVGGLVGWAYSSTVSNSYASGVVTGSGRVGGLAGYASSSATISNSYASGAVDGRYYVGGLVGSNDSSTAIDSYYDENVSGQNDVGKGIGETTEEMKKQSTYVDWDFDTIWQITSDNYPTLR